MKTMSKKRLKGKKDFINDALRSRNDLLCEKLRDARRLSQLTQAEVAHRFGRDQTFISKIESGIREVSFVEVERLIRIYNIDLGNFWDVRLFLA
jgi:transcriptional regulator with XRE-family HTH domain